MIKTKKDLREYLEADRAQYGRPYKLFRKWLMHGEDFHVRLFLVTLRHYEYYLNKKRTLLDYIPFFFINGTIIGSGRKQTFTSIPILQDQDLTSAMQASG